MTQTKKRYVQVGVGARSGIFTRAVTERFAENCEMVGICDTNQARMDFCNQRFAKDKPIPTFPPQEFGKMLRKTKPDIVIVSSVDSTHCDYICRALKAGCDVITEKPMTIDAKSTRKILQTIEKTGRKVTVTFNARYIPQHEQLKELLVAGTVGEILSVNLSWKLDVRHGADYFRRWHRQRRYSGSLLIHKATHHFDLVNWWLDDVPEEVFAHGSLRFYTPENGDKLGLKNRGQRCVSCPLKGTCKFFFDLNKDSGRQTMYLNAEKDDGYIRDQCPFSDEIDIWDTMSLSVKYKKGAILSYLLHAYSPFEGFHVAFNGANGRLEHVRGEKGFDIGINPGEEATKSNLTAVYYPLFGEEQNITMRTGEGGHGGGDPRLVEDIFAPVATPDPMKKKADAMAGAYSVLIGAAAAQSIDTGKAVNIAKLLGR